MHWFIEGTDELIAHFPVIRHGPHRKRCLKQLFVAAGKCLLSRCLATIGGHTVKSSKFLRTLASTAILGSESYKTHDRISLSDDSGSLQTTGSAVHILKYGIHRPTLSPLKQHGQYRKRPVQQFFYFRVSIRCNGKVFNQAFA
jgi:hypothetical protein